MIKITAIYEKYRKIILKKLKFNKKEFVIVWEKNKKI